MVEEPRVDSTIPSQTHGFPTTSCALNFKPNLDQDWEANGVIHPAFGPEITSKWLVDTYCKYLA